MSFDMTAALRPGVPADPGPWTPSPEFSFVGGNNDGDNVPSGALAEALTNALRREGRHLATYNLGGSPLGYEPLRRFVIDQLGGRAGIGACAGVGDGVGDGAGVTASPDQVLITSGSLQALDLVNRAMLSPGDTVLIEMATYGGMVTRLGAAGVRLVGVHLDDHGIRPDHLRERLAELAGRGIKPRYLYTIPTVQNPTGSVMPLERRHEIIEICREFSVPIFEDECYADLTWGCDRPPSFRALAPDLTVYCGSFSKSIAPALRVGYIIADEPVIRRICGLKTDAGTGALEQLALADFCPTHFDDHVDRLIGALRTKADAMVTAVRTHFGDEVAVTEPMGGIYVWLTFPEGTDTESFQPAANAAGIEFNPGAGWSADPAWGRRHLRLCFGAPDVATIDTGVARLANIYRGHPPESGLS